MLHSSSSIASPFLLNPLPPPVPPPRAKSPQLLIQRGAAPGRWRSDVEAPPIVTPNAHAHLLSAPPMALPEKSTIDKDQRKAAGPRAEASTASPASWLSWQGWRPWLKRRIAEIERAPSWLVSLVFHLCLILILALITAAARSAGPVLLMSFERGEAGEANELAVFEISQMDIPEPEMASDRSIEAEALVTLEPMVAVDTAASLQLLPVATKVTQATAGEDQAAPAAGEVIASQAGSEVARMFSGRTGPMKAELLKRGGGDQSTEQAVALGLAWLKRQQQPDGSWSLRGPYSDGSLSSNPVAATSMAMLAFMGAGNTHRSGEYKKELWDAVRWLAKQQDAKGFMAHEGGDHEKMYAQAQATIALCELYAMTGDSWLRPKAQLACDFAVGAQSPEGGWRYYPRMDSDTSVTGWFVMGLKSGQVGNLKIDPYVFTRVRRYLESVVHYDGAAYAYQTRDAASPSMTAEGLLIQQYLGMSRDEPAMNHGLNALVTNHLINPNDQDVYYWYYATQAIHHLGTALWDTWNGNMKRTIPPMQRKTGPEAGSWDPADDVWGMYAGRLYVTCLSLYCLEVYYRHMPLYETTNVVDE